MNSVRALLVALTVSLLFGCQGLETPGLSLANAHLAEGPVILSRDGHYYLRYRRALEEGGRYPLYSVLYVRKTADAGYYFFSVLISHVEWGQLIERPLAYDQLEDFARDGRVYWLDPDGTKHAIPVRPAGEVAAD
jgi:hypothetical protein